MSNQQLGGGVAGSGGNNPVEPDGGGSLTASLPGPDLSRGQVLGLVVLAVALAAIIAIKRSSEASSAAEQVEAVRGADLGDVAVEADEEAEGPTLTVPASPDNELEKDEAILTYLKDSGHISGGDD